MVYRQQSEQPLSHYLVEPCRHIGPDFIPAEQCSDGFRSLTCVPVPICVISSPPTLYEPSDPFESVTSGKPAWRYSRPEGGDEESTSRPASTLACQQSSRAGRVPPSAHSGPMDTAFGRMRVSGRRREPRPRNLPPSVSLPAAGERASRRHQTWRGRWRP